VVQRAQARAGHQHDGKPQRLDEVHDVPTGIERDEQAAGALDHQRTASEAPEGFDDGTEGRDDAHARRRDARCKRSPEAMDADLVEGVAATRRGAELERVGRAGQPGTAALVGLNGAGLSPASARRERSAAATCVFPPRYRSR
jgi:hypothetical protein